MPPDVGSSGRSSREGATALPFADAQGVSRRTLFHMAGLAAASALALRLPPLAESPRLVGLLMPEGAAAQSVRAALAAEYRVVSRAVGTAPSALVAEARSLLAAGRMDALVGALNARAAPRVAALLAEASIPFVALEAGANAPTAAERLPGLVYRTAGYWQASYAAGAWAARQIGRRAHVLTSLYESGYDALHAFGLGLREHGGTVVATTVTRLPGEIPAAVAALGRTAPDLVYAMYGGAEAVTVLRAYRAAGLRSRVPLLAAPFMADAVRGEPAAEGLRSVATWVDGEPLGALAPGGVAVRATGGAPLHLRELRGGGHQVVGRLGDTAELAAVADRIRPEPRSGWLDPHVGY